MRTAIALLCGAIALAGGPQASEQQRDLTNPAAFTETAPETYRARFETTVGAVVILVTRAWAPHGADRFYNLVKAGFYDGCRFFRVIPKFAAQFGIHGDPAVNAAWFKATIPADRARMANIRKRVTFAMVPTDPASRTTQVFINYGDNSKLDIDGFAPFGEVTVGMVLAELFFDKYGEGPDQALILAGGNAFLQKYMPRLDYIKAAKIMQP
jgi:peptidyl-prolyl cis-trans isomerase A (cyclophilin A)